MTKTKTYYYYRKGSAAAASVLFSVVAFSSSQRNVTAFCTVMLSALNRCRSSSAVGIAMATTIRIVEPSPTIVVGRVWPCGFGFCSRRDSTLKGKDDGRVDSEGEEVAESGSLHSNIYQPWSIADDYYLYKFQKDPIPKLASKLGRGLVGVRTRLQKLNDVKSQAYERLFTSSGKQIQVLASVLASFKADADIHHSGGNYNGLPSSASSSSDPHKLTAVRDVLRRIQWDATLTPSEFSVCYYDRVADTLQTVPFTQPNLSVEGQCELFVLAIPEHRIVSVSYKDRIVWDKSTRLDYICGSGKRHDDDKATTIHDVIETYSEWQRLQDEIREHRLLRQRIAVQRVKEILGEERYHTLRQSSDELRRTYGGQYDDNNNEHKLVQIKAYVRSSFTLFEQARKENINLTFSNDDWMSNHENKHQLNVSTEEVFSELVSTLGDAALRHAILLEINNIANQFYNKKLTSKQPPPVIQLREEDLTETFTKGGGAGGQKINKTSNRVILTHNPTQISVSVQETRSLHQNRKIARKRLLEKVDIYMHGSNSKYAIRAMKDAENKSKAKARSRAKYKKRTETSLVQNAFDEEGPELVE
jgi:uncharacterized protein (UPF0248 family)